MSADQAFKIVYRFFVPAHVKVLGRFEVPVLNECEPLGSST